MKEITDTQRQWENAKDEVQHSLEREGRFGLAAKYAKCKMFTGNETLEELAKLIFTPQGTEFVTKHGFPDLKTLRKFKKYHPERLGVYIDSGKIELSEVRNVLLAGDTSAKLKYADTASNKVILLCGATAEVECSGYSVTKSYSDKSSSVKITRNEHSIAL